MLLLHHLKPISVIFLKKAYEYLEKYCVLSSCSHVRFFVTQWTVAHQATLSMGFSRQEYWSGLPCPPLGDLLDPGMEPASPTLAGGSLPSVPPRKPKGSLRHSLENTSLCMFS